ncbi:MAG: hypothetical protein ACLT1W_11520 [Alistipes onderdonkii]
MTFEQLGIDALLVDEAHAYKNSVLQPTCKTLKESTRQRQRGTKVYG